MYEPRMQRLSFVVCLISALTVVYSISVAEVAAQRGGTGTKQSPATSKKEAIGGGTVCPSGIRRWDGEGSTNNWSEAANWCDNTLPPANSTIVFDFTSVKNATVDVTASMNIVNLNAGYTGTVSIAEGVTITANNLSIGDGTFSVSAGVVDVNNQMNVTGTGTFNGGAGLVKLAGSLTFSNNNGAQFLPAVGTIEFDGINGAVFVFTPNGHMSFFNLTVNTTTDAGGLYFDTNGGVRSGSVLGTLNLMNGTIGSGIVYSYGPVNYQPTFDGGAGYLYFYGSEPRTINLPAGVPMVNLMGLFAANTTVNVTGTGTITFGSRWDIGAGSFNTGLADVVMQNSQISGGIFNVDKGTTLTSSAIIDITAGTLNAIDAEYVRFSSITIRGAGILNGPSSTMYVGGLFNINEGGGADFYHNNGTAYFEGNNCGVAVNNTTAGTTRFHTLIVDLPQDTSIFSFDANGGIDSAIIEGNTFLINGLYAGGTLYTRRSVTVASTFDGGAGSLYFDGPLIQNLVNQGGINPTGLFTVNKDPGTFVLVSGSFVLSTGTTVVVARGGLKMANNVDVTIGSLITGENGYLIVNTPADVILGGTVTNNGRIDLRHDSASCPSANDLIVLRSSTNGSQRAWTGTGVSMMIGVDVRDMGGTQEILVWGGINTGNNGSNWTFFGTCPPAVSVSVGGRATTADGVGIAKARISMTDTSGNIRTALTNQFGYYSFDNVRATDAYVVSIRHKLYQFSNSPRIVSVNAQIDDLNFNAMPQGSARDSDGGYTIEMRDGLP